MDCQLADRAASSHRDTTVSPAQEYPHDPTMLHGHLHQVPTDDRASCGQCCCGQCQPGHRVQECCKATYPGKTTRRKFRNQPDGSLCLSVPRLIAGTPASCDHLIKKCHVDEGFSQCYSRVTGDRELELQNRSRNLHSNITRLASGQYYHNHRQKPSRSYLSTEAHNLNQQKYGLTTNMKPSLSIEQPASTTVNKDQATSENLLVRKCSLSERLENTIQQHYHPLQRHAPTIIQPPESINNQDLFQTDADNSSVSRKRSAHSSSITETSKNNKGDYSLIEADFKRDRIDSNSEGIYSNIKAINSNSNQIHPISSDIKNYCNLNELTHKCIDSYSSYLQYSPGSPIAGEFIFEEYCLQKDRRSSGKVCVDKLGHIRIPASEKHKDSSALNEAIAGKFLVKDLSKAKPQTVTGEGTKLQLLTCTICHWAFTERDALVKHRQTVHGLVTAILGGEAYSMTVNNVATRDGQNRKIHIIDVASEHDRDNCNLETYVAENSRGSTNNPGSVCESNQNVTDCKSPSVSRHGCHGQNPDFAGSYLTSSACSVSPPCNRSHLSPHTMEMSRCNENCQLGCGVAPTMGEMTVGSWINNNPTVDMSRGATISLFGMSQIHHCPLDLSNCGVRNNHSPIGGCHRRGWKSNISTSDSVAHLQSVHNNSGFVCGLPLGHGAPLAGSTDASLRLSSDYLMNDVREYDRDTCMNTPASANGIPAGCSPGGDNSISVKRNVTSHQSFPFRSRNRVVAYQTVRLTHTQTHLQTNAAYRCHTCHQNFAFSRDLKVHLCPEGINKPYTCPQCQHTFAKNIHLKRHLATHSGLKPYPCWICGKRFSRSDHLKRHTQSLHAGSKPHGCHVCGKEFVRKYELSKHMTVHNVYMNG